MNADILTWITVALSGVLLGIFFYGGLWWTTRKGLIAKHPAILFLVSMIVRTAVVLIGFYFLSAGQWQRILVCLAGFTLARLLMLRYTKKEAMTLSPAKKEES
jgi:F1F0 ATPase subunit 2